LYLQDDDIAHKFKSAFNLCAEDVNTSFDRFYESKAQIDNYFNVIIVKSYKDKFLIL